MATSGPVFVGSRNQVSRQCTEIAACLWRPNFIGATGKAIIRAVVLLMSLASVLFAPAMGDECGDLYSMVREDLVKSEGEQRLPQLRFEPQRKILTPAIRAELRSHIGSLYLGTLADFCRDDADSLSSVLGDLEFGVLSLDSTTIQPLARHRGSLCIRGISTIDPDLAKVLGGRRGKLRLPDVAHATPESLLLLASAADRLELGLESLSEKQASSLSRVRSALTLPRLKAIDRASAEALSPCNGSLALGLRELSCDVARVFASRSGALEFLDSRWEHRDGIEGLRLTADTARELASYDGDLKLGHADLGHSPQSVLEALATHKGMLWLDVDEPLSDFMADALSKHIGSIRLSLKHSLTRSAADALARHEGSLDLCCTAGLCPVEVQSLALHRGPELTLRNVVGLDESAAFALAKHRGSLRLYDPVGQPWNGPAKVVETLAKHVGPLSIDASLVRDDTIESLLSHSGGLHISYFISASLPVKHMQRLSSYGGPLGVSGRLSDESAVALSMHRGELVLGDLPPSPAASEALLGKKGRLFFPRTCNVRSVAAARLMASDRVATDIVTNRCLLTPESAEIAAALAARNRPLSMPDLRYITTDALKALAQKQDVELLPLDELYVFDKVGSVVPAESVVPASFREFNQTHQPPTSLGSHW